MNEHGEDSVRIRRATIGSLAGKLEKQTEG